MALTIKQIMRALYSFPGGYERIERVSNVKVTQVKRGVSRSAGTVRFIARTRTPESRGGRVVLVPYVTSLDFFTPKFARISCSCDDFWATWEWALAKRGNAEVIYGNGDPPDARNPRYTPGCCVAEGSLIPTTRGLVPIQDICVGDEALTLKGYQPVSAAALTRRKTAILELTTNRGTLRVTPDHLVLVARAGSALPRWTEAADIQHGDYLVRQTPLVSTRPFDVDSKAFLLGVLTCEVGEQGYAPIEPELKVEIQRHLKRLGLSLDFNSAIMPNMLTPAVCDTLQIDPEITSKTASLPSWVFTQTEAWRKSLLLGLFEGDGWISGRSAAATFGSSSRQLVDQVQALLYSVGIESSISTQVTGVSKITMHLARLSSTGAELLKTMLPSLAKYGKRKMRPVLATRKIGLQARDLTLAARAKYVDDMKAACGGQDTEEVLRVSDLAEELQVGMDSLLADLRASTPDTLVKMEAAASTRRPYGIQRRHAYQVHWDTQLADNGRKIPLPKLNSSDKYVSRDKLADWLAQVHEHATGASLKRFVHHVGRLLRDDVELSLVTQIARTTSDVYDLSVPAGEQFVADGFVVHNCKHVVAVTNVLVKDGFLTSDFEIPRA